MRQNTLMGQHFLRSEKIIERIVDVAEIDASDTVLEIGPGEGLLTATLAKRAKQIIAVEKDPRFFRLLTEKFHSAANVHIVEGDILKLDFTDIVPENYKIVANLPYYITSRLLRIALENVRKPSSMTLMVQREVAERIVATPPKMNMLALSIQAYGTPRIAFRVSRGQFHPPPDVDSAIITIKNISDSFFKKQKISEKVFFEKTKKAFSQKRKMLRNTLDIHSTKRPGELSLEEWATICRTHTAYSNQD